MNLDERKMERNEERTVKRTFIMDVARQKRRKIRISPLYEAKCGVSVDRVQKQKQTPWPESASELYQPSYRRLSAKILLTFADRGCHVVSVTDPYGRILGFLARNRNFFFQVAPHLYSRG
jgi:hypothetical protein